MDVFWFLIKWSRVLKNFFMRFARVIFSSFHIFWKILSKIVMFFPSFSPHFFDFLVSIVIYIFSPFLRRSWLCRPIKFFNFSEIFEPWFQFDLSRYGAGFLMSELMTLIWCGCGERSDEETKKRINLEISVSMRWLFELISVLETFNVEFPFDGVSLIINWT